MNIQKKIKLLDKKIQALDIVIKNQQEKMEYLYEREKQRENFEKAAKDLVSLVYAAEKKEPGKPRTLYLDIDGHRNAQGRFDADMRSSKRDSD